MEPLGVAPGGFFVSSSRARMGAGKSHLSEEILMKVERLALPGLWLIRPDVHVDERGLFLETYRWGRYKRFGLPDFVQDNLSVSRKGVLRGLHFQKPPFAQAKLVQVIAGAAADVAVDIRTGSPTFGQYQMVTLTGEERQQFFIPAGFAHGFWALTDGMIFSYKVSAPYSKDDDGGIRFDDPDIAIVWGPGASIVSEKDQRLPLLRDLPPGLFQYEEDKI
jgi:dTDP-4-dehydrorhamnose 3,5-epimerase